MAGHLSLHLPGPQASIFLFVKWCMWQLLDHSPPPHTPAQLQDHLLHSCWPRRGHMQMSGCPENRLAAGSWQVNPECRGGYNASESPVARSHLLLLTFRPLWCPSLGVPRVWVGVHRSPATDLAFSTSAPSIWKTGMNVLEWRKRTEIGPLQVSSSLTKGEGEEPLSHFSLAGSR